MTPTRKQTAERIILGIDPGTNIMGYGVLRVLGNKPEMMALGVVDMRKIPDTYLKLGKIFERVVGIIDEYHPDEMAIEAPFYSKNVQSLIKLGRAQGVAISAAIYRDIFIHEYAPLKIKMAITGQGQASKEQVAGMLQRLLNISKDEMPKFMDATDALGAAYCHFLQSSRPDIDTPHYGSWSDFVRRNPKKIKR
jgi:crossover junction endodeoxyribonuclease RuvC